MRSPRGLHTLARLHGVQTAYHDNDGRRVAAGPDALMAALHALRVPIRGAADIDALLEHRRREIWDRTVEPVVVAWVGERGGPGHFRLRLPARHAGARVSVTVTLEEGGERAGTVDAASLKVLETGTVAGVDHVALGVPLPVLPPGYHDLRVEVGAGPGLRRLDALVIAAPRRAMGWERFVGDRAWGLFAPLYALRETDGHDEIPTFHLLDRLAGQVAERGGAVVGTLPLLAAFLDEPFEPSPYAPVSRLFWNELYAAPPAGADGPAGGDVGADLFDPRAAMVTRRAALESGAASFFADADGDPPELAPFLVRNPMVRDYARFRALVERHGGWGGWQERLRARDVRAGDYDEAAARYHLYVQWLAERQLNTVRERAESRGVGLYLDLPLGVHPGGYDVWRERALFALAASAGAPPDPLAAGGQDWGFPPMHPEASRFDRHRYFIASIRTHLRFARVLRIDHVMQLHRMYWVVGGDARSGVYVRYPAEELHAILCLESRRAGAVIVGEDLGTVPGVVRRDMRRHGLPGMYVGQFELMEADAESDRAAGAGEPDSGPPLVPRPVPAGALAAIGTHDTPTFAGWWHGTDIDLRERLGQIDPDTAGSERAGRAMMRQKLARGLGVERECATEGRDTDDVAVDVHRALLERMGRSRAGLVLATMEDLWLEREPQNVPGTTLDRNWRRRAARPLAALGQPDVVSTLELLNESREGNE